LSLFKPLWLVEGEGMTYCEENLNDAVSYWKRQEELHRAILEQRVSVPDYQRDRDKLEKSIIDRVNSIDVHSENSKELAEIMKYALAEEKRLQDRYLQLAGEKQPVMKGNLYFNYYWKKMNHKLRRTH
jgi:hypothetical protein